MEMKKHILIATLMFSALIAGCGTPAIIKKAHQEVVWVNSWGKSSISRMKIDVFEAA